MARQRKRVPAGTADSPHARVKRHLVQRLYCRFHMTLILGTAGLAAMMVSWILLQLHVDSMWIRYTVAVVVAYAVFLLGVGLWLRYVAQLRREPAVPTSASGLDGVHPADALSMVDAAGDLGGGALRTGGKISTGGDFGGGGASGSWGEAGMQQGFVANSHPRSAPTGKGIDFGFDFDLDGEGLVVLAFALAVIAAVVFSSGYLVWFAPDILAEAVVGAALAGGLAKTSRREDGSGWVMGVVKKTWWPFAIVLVLSVSFALFAQSTYPDAKTAKDVLQRAGASSDERKSAPSTGYP